MRHYIYVVLAFMLMFCSVSEAGAREGKRYFINNGWYCNWILSSDYVRCGEGIGSYFEGGYYVNPLLAIGGFMSFGANDDYFPKKTYPLEDGPALTTDLTNSLYQIPFGTLVRFRFLQNKIQPYVQARIGAEYSTQSTYLSTFVSKYDNWGLYLSPEIGLTFYPFRKAHMGFHIAIYYSYATNGNDDYSIDGINNLGFKFGFAF